MRIKHYLNVLLFFLRLWTHLGKGLPVTPSLTTGLAATLSSPPMLFVAEHLYNDDVHDGDDDAADEDDDDSDDDDAAADDDDDDDDYDDGDDDELSHLHNPWCW